MLWQFLLCDKVTRSYTYFIFYIYIHIPFLYYLPSWSIWLGKSLVLLISVNYVPVQRYHLGECGLGTWGLQRRDLLRATASPGWGKVLPESLGWGRNLGCSGGGEGICFCVRLDHLARVYLAAAKAGVSGVGTEEDLFHTPTNWS